MCVFVQTMERSLKGIFVFYSFVGAIILIVMSTLAGAALRSTKSQVKQLETPTSTHIITDSAENFECKWSVFIQHFSSLEDHFTVQVIPIQPFTHTFIQCISGQHFFHEGQFGVQYLVPRTLRHADGEDSESMIFCFEDDRSTP